MTRSPKNQFADHATIAVGDGPPPLERTITLTDMVAYAGATWDWHKLHYDQAYAAEMDLPGPIVDGQVHGAYMVQMLQDWLGPQSFVHQLEFTFRNLVFADERLRFTGEVTEVVPGEQITVAMDVVVMAEDGSEDRVAVKPARAVVLLGRADGPGASEREEQR